MKKRRFLSTPFGVGLILMGLLSLASGAGAAVLGLGPERAVAIDGDPPDGSLIDDLLPPMINHTDPKGPIFTGDYAPIQATQPSELIVVSYNLRYGEAIDETIRAYREANPLPAADIILLQEMDEIGVRAIAAGLGYNFVYFPASVAEDGDNFGNAILSRWPLENSAKLILPGLHPITGQQRTATRATVNMGDTQVLVYSTHIEVATAPPAYRAAQFAAILDDIPADAPRVIVGGDFNTVTGWGVEALAEMYAAAGLDHASADLGPTYTRFGVRPSATDHIFSLGFTRLESGVLTSITASDHFPVWARFALP